MMRGIVALLVAGLLVSVGIVSVLWSTPRAVTFYLYDQHGKPPGVGGGPKDKGGGGYDILAKWQDTPVSYVFDDDGSGLDRAFVETALGLSSEEWDSYTSTELASAPAYMQGADFDTVRDGVNEVSFGDYSEAGVIAVCRMWIARGWPPKNKYLVEFDLMFDTDYAWGDATVNPAVMDLQNIATHELGHGIAGLGDLYEDRYSQETMYGYADYGEIIKRNLNDGDIAGVQKNYGT